MDLLNFLKNYSIYYNDNKLVELIIDSLDMDIYKIGLVFHHLYKEKYNFSSKGWFYYDYNIYRWVNDYNPIVNDIKTYFSYQYNSLCNSIPDHKTEFLSYKKIIWEIIDNLRDEIFIKNLLNVLQNIFTNNNLYFELLLDSKEELVGYNNGVLNKYTLKFRAGLPTDYIYKNYNNTVYKVNPEHNYVRLNKYMIN